jgi:hypothetical protein
MAAARPAASWPVARRAGSQSKAVEQRVRLPAAVTEERRLDVVHRGLVEDRAARPGHRVHLAVPVVWPSMAVQQPAVLRPMVEGRRSVPPGPAALRAAEEACPDVSRQEEAAAVRQAAPREAAEVLVARPVAVAVPGEPQGAAEARGVQPAEGAVPALPREGEEAQQASPEAAGQASLPAAASACSDLRQAAPARR